MITLLKKISKYIFQCLVRNWRLSLNVTSTHDPNDCSCPQRLPSCAQIGLIQKAACVKVRLLLLLLLQNGVFGLCHVHTN